jgi:DNA-binding PadR family transcriptional regulator
MKQTHRHWRGRHPHHHEGGHGRRFAPRFGPGVGKRRRGDVRTALLRLLSERPMHGYDLMKELEERSGGMWRPSPGSVYPTLQLLEDEGLVKAEDEDGKRVYAITDEGRRELDERTKRSGRAPWESDWDDEGLAQLRDAGFKLAAASMQLAKTGSTEQRKQAADILAEARRKLYALLAE